MNIKFYNQSSVIRIIFVGYINYTENLSTKILKVCPIVAMYIQAIGPSP